MNIKEFHIYSTASGSNTIRKAHYVLKNNNPDFYLSDSLYFTSNNCYGVSWYVVFNSNENKISVNLNVVYLNGSGDDISKYSTTVLYR